MKKFLMLLLFAVSAHAQTPFDNVNRIDHLDPETGAFPTQTYFTDWSVRDVALQTTVSVMLLRDEQQTEQIARNPNQFYEKNKILGEHPSVGAVRSYFVGYAITSAVVTWALPERYRPWWQGAQIGVELIVTQRNRSIGIKGAF